VQAPTTRLRLIQVGVGGWGATWLDRVLLSPTWELAGIVDASEAQLRDARERTGIDASACFGSIGAARAAVEADAALVVVPAEAHLAVAGEALEVGWHVLVEKPIADTMAAAHELVRRAEAAGRVLMVSQNYRFRRTSQIVQAIMEEGWLGPVHHASVQVYKELHFTLPDVPHGFGAYAFARDAAIHHLDQIRACLAAEPVRVYGQSHNPEWSWFTKPPMLTALIELEGGGLVQFYGSWIARGRSTTFDGDWHVECANGQLRWERGQVMVRPTEPWLSIQMDGFVERERGWMEAEIPAGMTEDRTHVLELFGTCLQTGREPPTSGRDNLRTAALAFALADSAADGLPRQIADYL